MNTDMERLRNAVEGASPVSLADREREAIVHAVLLELVAITRERADHDLHEAQIHRYTDIAVRTALQGL
jgi:hypothetical protein